MFATEAWLMIKDLTPPSIRELQHLVDAFDVSFEELKKHIIKVLIYPRIDEIEDERLLDLLGWQFHIEGYDQAQTIQEKRNLIKYAIELHRYKGTPYAVKKVFQALNLEADLSEWFDYNGDPYKFKVLVKSVIQDEDTYRRLTELINEYKNVRSWLDAIGFHREYSQTLYYAFAQKDRKHYHIGLHVDPTSVEQATLYAVLAQRIRTAYHIGLHVDPTSVEQATLYAVLAQRIRTAYHIGLHVDPISVEQATLYTGFAQRVGTAYHIGLHVDPISVEQATLYTGFAQRVGTAYHIGLQVDPSVVPYTFYAGLAQRIASYMAIYPAN